VYKIIQILLMFLFLTGCSVRSIKTTPDYKYTEKKSYQSHQKQYNFDQNLHEHHNNIKNLQGEVDDLLNDMDGGGNSSSSSSYRQRTKTSNYRNSYGSSDVEDMCNDVYIRYVKLLNRGADRSIVSRAYRNYKKCDAKKRYLQR